VVSSNIQSLSFINHKVILQGGGGHARVVLDCLLDQGVEVVGIFDPQLSGSLHGIAYLGAYDPSFEPSGKAVIAIGDNAIRRKVAQECKHAFANAVHPTAVISKRAALGTGDMILHRSIVQASVSIGNHVILNTASQIDHDCVIGDYAHVGPGAVLCGAVTVGEGSFIGAGAVIIPGRAIGKWAIIGAGTVVRTDIPDFAVAVGNPARIIKYVTL